MVAINVQIFRIAVTIAVSASCIMSSARAAAMYDVPAPLPPAVPGTVIWQRAWTSGAAPKTAARNILLLYHTRDALGRDQPVSGTISIPRSTAPEGGWPIISFAHGTTGNAPQCAPSTFAQPNGEQRMVNEFVAHGYAVAQTDYEGEATPEIHPYFVGVAGAHDVIDIVKAARSIEPSLGTRWLVMGHSEGGAVALFAAREAKAWAPKLTLVGAVAYAPGAYITDFLSAVLSQGQPTRMLPLLGMMIEGIASSDRAISLDRMLTPQAQTLFAMLQQQCAGTLMNGSPWTTFRPKQIFRTGVDLMPLALDFQKNEPGNVSVPVPLRIEQGTADTIVPYDTTESLAVQLRDHGSHPQVDRVAGGSHGSILESTFDAVQAWVQAQFAK